MKSRMDGAGAGSLGREGKPPTMGVRETVVSRSNGETVWNLGRGSSNFEVAEGCTALRISFGAQLGCPRCPL